MTSAYKAFYGKTSTGILLIVVSFVLFPRGEWKGNQGRVTKFGQESLWGGQTLKKGMERKKWGSEIHDTEKGGSIGKEREVGDEIRRNHKTQIRVPTTYKG